MPSNTTLRCPQEACNTVVIGDDSKRLMKHHNQPQFHGHRFPQGPRGYKEGQGFSGFPPHESRLIGEGYIACQECPYDGCTTIIVGSDWKTLMQLHTRMHGNRFEETNLGRMPPEILLIILRYLISSDPEKKEKYCSRDHLFPQRHILRLASVCKKFNELIKCPELYRELILFEHRCTYGYDCEQGNGVIPMQSFKNMIKSSGSQLWKITCQGRNTGLVCHALKNCGDTLQEVLVKGKTLIGVASMLDQISKKNPVALKHLQFHDVAHLDELTFTLDQRRSDEPFSSRIVGLRTKCCWKAANTAKLISLAMRGMQRLGKVTLVNITTLDYNDVLRHFKMVVGYEVSFSELRYVETQSACGQRCWVSELDVTWKSNAELSLKNPSEAFNMFLQGLKGIKSVNQEV